LIIDVPVARSSGPSFFSAMASARRNTGSASGGEALLEPGCAGIVEGSHEAGIVGRHRLLRDRESAVEYRRRLARTSLLAVEESELAQGPGESEVGVAEDLGRFTAST
jgi:hypothetical protein